MFPPGSIAFILETGSKRINPPEDILQLALARDANEYYQKIVTLMLESTGKVWSTLHIKPEEIEVAKGGLSAEDLVNIMQVYSNLNQKEWTSKLWELTMKTNATAEEKLIVKYQQKANQLRIGIQKEEQAKNLARYVDKVDDLLLTEFEPLDQLEVIKMKSDGSTTGMDFFGVLKLMANQTVILLGDPGLGKSALARALCTNYCKAMGSPITYQLPRLIPFGLLVSNNCSKRMCQSCSMSGVRMANIADLMGLIC